MTYDLHGNAAGVGGALDVERTSIDDTDSPYATKGEQIIHVDTTNGAVTIEVQSADIRTDHRLKVVDTGLNAATNAITLTTEGAETFNPGAVSSITLTVDGTWVDLWSDGTNLFTDRAAELDSLATGDLDINNVSGRVEKTANQAISADTDTTIDWDSQGFDTDLYTYNTTDDDIQVASAGDYTVMGQLRWSGVADQDLLFAKILVGGVLKANFAEAVSGTGISTVKFAVTLRDLSANDKVRIDARSDASNTLVGNNIFTFATITKTG